MPWEVKLDFTFCPSFMKTLYCISWVQVRFNIKKDSKLKLNNFVQSMYIQCFALIVSIVRFNDSYRILTGPNIFISNFWIYTAGGPHNNIKAQNNKKRLKDSTPHIWKIYMTPYIEKIMSVLRDCNLVDLSLPQP